MKTLAQTFALSAWLAVASVLLCGCATTRQPQTTPDAVWVQDRFRAEVDAAFWVAAAHLEAIGIGHRHDVRRVSVVPGTVSYGGDRWGAPAEFSPTGFAGGWATPEEITLVCNPRNLALWAPAARHEWAEVFLMRDGNVRGTKYEGKTTTMDERHLIIEEGGL